MIGIGRIDLKVDDSGCAACVISNSELLFIRFNGNRVVPRLEGFIQNETSRRIEEVKYDIGKQFFNRWIQTNVPEFEPYVPNVD